jgi:GTP cyclohydrolase II
MADPTLSPSGGAIIYLRQEGRGIGLGEKLKAYNLQDLGNDTYEANVLLRHPADARSYGLATAMLVDLGLGGEDGIRLLTNNPDKVRAVEGPGREVVVRERVAMVPLAWKTGGKEGVKGAEVEKYLSTKVSLSMSSQAGTMGANARRLRSSSICLTSSNLTQLATTAFRRPELNCIVSAAFDWTATLQLSVFDFPPDWVGLGWTVASSHYTRRPLSVHDRFDTTYAYAYA